MRSKYEIKCEKELRADGWQTDSKAGMSRFAKQRDYWSLFDILAVKKGEPLRCIAVKGKAGDYHKLLPLIKAFWMPECCQKEMWRYSGSKKYKGLPIKIIIGNTPNDRDHENSASI